MLDPPRRSKRAKSRGESPQYGASTRARPASVIALNGSPSSKKKNAAPEAEDLLGLGIDDEFLFTAGTRDRGVSAPLPPRSSYSNAEAKFADDFMTPPSSNPTKRKKNWNRSADPFEMNGDAGDSSDAGSGSSYTSSHSSDNEDSPLASSRQRSKSSISPPKGHKQKYATMKPTSSTSSRTSRSSRSPPLSNTVPGRGRASSHGLFTLNEAEEDAIRTSKQKSKSKKRSHRKKSKKSAAEPRNPFDLTDDEEEPGGDGDESAEGSGDTGGDKLDFNHGRSRSRSEQVYSLREEELRSHKSKHRSSRHRKKSSSKHRERRDDSPSSGSSSSRSSGSPKHSKKHDRRTKHTLDIKHTLNMSAIKEASLQVSKEMAAKKKNVDVLFLLKRGTPMLKYGKRGFPHFRQFQISKDHAKIMWFTAGKRISETAVNLADVDDILFGQKTDNFRRYPNKKMDPLSFSLVYHDRKKTLDVICKSTRDFNLWTKGLRKLIDNARSRYSVQGAVELRELRMDIEDTRDADLQRLREMARSDPGNLAAPDIDKVLEKERLAAVLKYEKIDQMVKERYKISAGMKDRLRRIRDSLEDVVHKVDADDYAIARHMMWEAGVEMDSFENKLKAIFS